MYRILFETVLVLTVYVQD